MRSLSTWEMHSALFLQHIMQQKSIYIRTKSQLQTYEKNYVNIYFTAARTSLYYCCYKSFKNNVFFSFWNFNNYTLFKCWLIFIYGNFEIPGEILSHDLVTLYIILYVACNSITAFSFWERTKVNVFRTPKAIYFTFWATKFQWNYLSFYETMQCLLLFWNYYYMLND